MATCDVTQLMADAKCFLCLRGKQFDVAIAQLLCDINAVASAAADAEACADPFEDAFSGPVGQVLADPPWQQPGDTFLYNGGTAIEEPGSAGSVAYVRSLSFSDGYVQATLAALQDIVLLLRGDPTDVNNSYWAIVDTVNEAVLVYRGATLITLRYLPRDAQIGDVFRFEVRGSQLTLKWNGLTQIVCRDTTPSAVAGPGLPGMKGYGSNAEFSDFEACSWD